MPRSTDRTRPRRFALPDQEDSRAGESIEAFISGPTRRERGRRPRPIRAPLKTNDPLVGLQTRVDWNDALDREDARVDRYGRPASVAIVSVVSKNHGTHLDPDWVGRLARPVAHVLRRSARETDVIARTAEAAFYVLLPETSETEARHFIDRVGGDCDVWLSAVGLPVQVRAVVASAGPELRLTEALETAKTALGADAG
jgi:PleD family two-component response regulator